jgi:hypothetical protein
LREAKMMIRIISALLLSFSIACAVAQDAKPLELADSAPDRHIVVPGDTLWGISGKFLKEPYRWPELWRMNKEQVKNPHLIYPGQVLVLDRSGATPQLRLETVRLQPKVHSEPISKAIPSIPLSAIEPFLARPLVVDEAWIAQAPRIVATEESRVNIGPGGRAYTSALNTEIKAWEIYRPAKPVIDPENGDVLGYEAFHIGSAKPIDFHPRQTQLAAEGQPATLEIVSANREVGVHDRLAPSTSAGVINYAPHVPNFKIQGQVAAAYGGFKESETGRNAIVALNRGRQHGVEVGHVLALHRNSKEQTYREGDVQATFKLPPEKYGLVFVFRVFDRISYAMVMNVSRPVLVSDYVRTP